MRCKLIQMVIYESFNSCHTHKPFHACPHNMDNVNMDNVNK